MQITKPQSADNYAGTTFLTPQMARNLGELFPDETTYLNRMKLLRKTRLGLFEILQSRTDLPEDMKNLIIQQAENLDDIYDALTTYENGVPRP